MTTDQHAHDPADDPDATQTIEAAHADERHPTGQDATQALPVTPPTQALPVTPAPARPFADPVQDAPVAAGPSSAPPAPPTTPGPAPTADPAAQWNAAAEHRARQAPDPTLTGEDPHEHGLRVGTVVWGFVLVAVGAGILALALGATYDLDLALIALLSVAGLVLVVASIVSGIRRSARERARR